MGAGKGEKPYVLENRTFAFAQRAMSYFKALPRTLVNLEVARQGVRSSGSVGANFIEASEALSRKDFGHRVRICRKEAKETIYWLRLSEPTEKQEEERTHYLAHYDVPAHLPTRALIADRIRQALAKAKRDKTRLALMFVGGLVIGIAITYLIIK